MGFWGIVFACFMIPAIMMCLATRNHKVVGIIMGLNWIAYTIPFRNLIEFPDKNYYFVIVGATTAVALYIFSKHLVVSRIIIGLISLLLCFGYSPLVLGYVTLHQAMVFADVIGALQILAMYGGAGGELVRRIKPHNRFNSIWNYHGFSINRYGRSRTMVNERIQDADRAFQMSSSASGEKKR